jgi:hypothetical protein
MIFFNRLSIFLSVLDIIIAKVWMQVVCPSIMKERVCRITLSYSEAFFRCKISSKNYIVFKMGVSLHQMTDF